MAGAPALFANDATEMLAVVGRVGAVDVKEVVVVGAAATGRDVMSDVVVDRNDADVEQADVDADARLAEPEEVGDLLRVGDVVGRLELSAGLQVVEHCPSAVRLHPKSFSVHAHAGICSWE